MSESELTGIHATVEGYVHGVGFRYFVQETATGLGLTGWVRNRTDGTVEVLAEGERIHLEKLLAALRRGPRAAFVSGVDFEWLPATGAYTQFIVRMTE